MKEGSEFERFLALLRPSVALCRRIQTMLFQVKPTSLLKVVALVSFVAVHSEATTTVSASSHQLIFDSVWDPSNSERLAIGTHYDESGGTTAIDCFVGVDYNDEFQEAIYSAPNVCVDFRLFSSTTSTVPWGVISGISSTQAVIAKAQLDNHVVTTNDAVNLPAGYFPVGMSTDAAGGVYLAIHDTGDATPESAASNGKISGLYDYYNQMTHPSQSSQVTSPQLLKLDITTGGTIWDNTMDTTGGRSTVAGIAYMSARDLLIVVGSSNGTGSYVGAGVNTNTWDGYVTLVDAATGVVDDSRWAENNESESSSEHSMRIRSQVGQDEYILGLCVSNDDVYVIGTTTGRMGDGSAGGGGFVSKIDADMLNILWSVQFDGSGTEITHCDATSDFVYVAGNVPAGVLLDDSTRTSASDSQDVFVSLLDASSGSIEWTRQIDSQREDIMANIVYSSSADQLILTGNALDRDQESNYVYTLTVEHSSGDHDWQSLGEDEDPLGLSVTDSPASSPSSSPEQSPTSSPSHSKAELEEENIAIAAVLIPVIAVFVAVGVAYSRWTSGRGPVKSVEEVEQVEGELELAAEGPDNKIV
eukprot:Nitzschia sp. Nitz4//scaffold41_size133979//115607//117574//NITZ4_003370-RA/size133979-snap-gene-0.110-mRNA-1//1//CDS//3329551539//7861//frame0